MKRTDVDLYVMKFLPCPRLSFDLCTKSVLTKSFFSFSLHNDDG